MLSSGVSEFMYRSEFADAAVGVNLSCRKALMPQQLLNGIEVCPSIQQVGCIGMPQHVGAPFWQISR